MFKLQYPDLNYIKYVYVNFKSIEAKTEVLKIFRNTKFCGLNVGLFCNRINQD